MHKLRPFRNAVCAAFTAFCTALLCCTQVLQPCVHAEESATAPQLGIQEHGIYYTASDVLTAQMESVFAGNINLAMDADGTPVTTSLAVSSSLDIRTTYYAYNSRTSLSGMQCYIYAQAAYAALFDDLPYHGAGTISYNNSIQVMGQAPTVDYTLFAASRVMPGAYLRTTIEQDGTYNGSNGHSLIILGYNADGLTILEGNADSKGLIRIASYTWDNFNASVLTRYGRVISHVIQPDAAFYEAQYGMIFETMAADTGDDTSETTPAVPDEVFTMHRQNGHLQLPDLGDDFTWTSSDETVATVDANGVLTALTDGTVTVTASNGTDTYDYTIHLALVAWESLGDLNGDGVVDTTDAVSLLTHYTNSLTGTQAELSEDLQAIGDINDNGTWDTTDAVLVLRYYVHAMTNQDVPAETLWNELL